MSARGSNAFSLVFSTIHSNKSPSVEQEDATDQTSKGASGRSIGPFGKGGKGKGGKGGKGYYYDDYGYYDDYYYDDYYYDGKSNKGSKGSKGSGPGNVDYLVYNNVNVGYSGNGGGSSLQLQCTTYYASLDEIEARTTLFRDNSSIDRRQLSSVSSSNDYGGGDIKCALSYDFDDDVICVG